MYKIKRVREVSVVVLLVILFLIYFISEEFLNANHVFTYCLHKKLLGFECPGCGMTRALHSFMHLDFIKAFQLNYSVYFLVPFLIVNTAYLFNSNKSLILLRRITLYTLLVAMLILYVVRIIQYLS